MINIKTKTTTLTTPLPSFYIITTHKKHHQSPPKDRFNDRERKMRRKKKKIKRVNNKRIASTCIFLHVILEFRRKNARNKKCSDGRLILFCLDYKIHICFTVVNL